MPLNHSYMQNQPKFSNYFDHTIHVEDLTKHCYIEFMESDYCHRLISSWYN